MSAEKTTLQVLVEARAVIAAPKAWTQSVFARDESGVDIDPSSPKAVCFCSIGAIAKVTGLPDSDAGHCAAAAHLKKFMSGDIADFNDLSSHGEVLEAWDLAIAAEVA